MSHEDELTPAERDALARMPRELEPPRMLEDRTIKALRGEAVLTPARWSRRAMPRLLVGAAAGLLLYLGGLATGQWLATRQTADALKDLQQNNAMQAATLVQRTGSAYAEAIAALSRIPASTDSQYVVQGREVALSALIAAANQIVKLNPDDHAAVRILQALEHGDSSAVREGTRRVVWF
ncbi:MAG TPA: hypothetical protein VGP80_06925 [Gemmatimonadales bacterium]|jgi:hypothetical protein|nr:hypothetical protein [Gemmatimonadales bacterium]